MIQSEKPKTQKSKWIDSQDKARDYDIKQTIYLNKELEKKLTNLSIDAHYSSILFESFPKLEEKPSDKNGNYIDFRETAIYSEAQESFLENNNSVKQGNCCQKCGIF